MKVIITTSWDDGDILDMKLSRLLDRYSLKGTFYISQKYRKSRLSENEIHELSSRHEIGAHTLTHPDLRLISREEKKREIYGSKKWLEQVTGKKVEMFCYPSGFYDKESVEVVKECGFVGARTTESMKMKKVNNSFLMPITLQVYPFPFRKKDANTYYWRYLLQPLIERFRQLRNFGLQYKSMTSWGSVARATLDAVSLRGETFHLWGHSWEIEKYGMWEELEEFLKYCKKSSKREIVTNNQLTKLIYESNKQL